MFLSPKQIISQLMLSPGMKVLDLGTGFGENAILASSMVNPNGIIYALDVQKELLQKLKNLANSKKINNIEYVWGDIEHLGGTKLSDNIIDFVILSNVLFQLKDKDTAISEIKRILKPKGKIVVVDWTESFSNMGPHKDVVVQEKTARTLFEQNGFVFEKSINAGDYHYGIIFRYEK